MDQAPPFWDNRVDVEIEILKGWFPFKSNFYPWDKLSFQL